MPTGPKPQTITPDFISEVCASLCEGKAVRHRLPFEGRLHIERLLPFLCIYRDPVGVSDLETERLITGEASFLIASARPSQRARTAALVQRIVETLSAEFGAFLILEIWASAEVEEDETTDPEAVRPVFIVHGNEPEDEGMQRVLDTLRDALKRVSILRKSADVEVRYSWKIKPPKAAPLIPVDTLRALNCHSIGIAVQPIYRNPDRGDDFPLVLRKLHHGFSRALKRTCFSFTLNETSQRPRHYHTLGRRAMSRTVWDVDRKLAEISDSFDFLLQVTPINVVAGWHAFKRQSFERPPVFHYRPLAIDPAELKRKLYSINLDRVEDPTLDLIFREKRAELDRQLTMLVERNTRNFLYGSIQQYGSVEEPLLRNAAKILEAFPGRSGDDAAGGKLSAQAFAELARAEIARFRETIPDIKANVIVTEEVASMMCSSGGFLINAKMHIPKSRARALIEHEIGTHILTYWNARAQPFRLLASGLSGYDEFQEGLAVLSEHLVGGLSPARLRILAARVIAARYLQDGATFVETFQHLHQEHDFEQRSAYRIVTRIYRSGGFTKDAVYLRGLVGILEYFSKGGDLEPLLIGKIARRHIPVVRELRHRGVLIPPPLLPAYLSEKGPTARLKALTPGTTPIDLVNLNPRRKKPIASR